MIVQFVYTKVKWNIKPPKNQDNTYSKLFIDIIFIEYISPFRFGASLYIQVQKNPVP